MSAVPPFLQKAFEIFSEPAFEHICGWGESNDTIFIKDIDAFAKEILPRYFKHSNYSSFTRQLHKYDFHKTVHNPRHGEFKHPYFLRGQPQLMKHIQRKIYVNKKVPVDKSSDGNMSSGGNTDGETDGSSEKGSSLFEEDFDLDFEFFEDDGKNGHAESNFKPNSEVELDFDKFDEIESSVERGIIAFDSERISVLEKRQRDLMEENAQTKSDIHDTLQQNENIAQTIDCILGTMKENFDYPAVAGAGMSLEAPEDVDLDELCAVMKTKCKLQQTVSGMSDDLKNYMRSVLHQFHPLDIMSKRLRAEAK